MEGELSGTTIVVSKEIVEEVLIVMTDLHSSTISVNLSLLLKRKFLKYHSLPQRFQSGI